MRTVLLPERQSGTDAAERSLVERMQAGDAEALRSFFEGHARRLYAFLHARTGGDVALSEELLQETCVAALESLASFEGRSSLWTWLCAIARNKIATHLKRRPGSAAPVADAMSRDPAESPPDRVALTLTALAPRYQEVLLDKYVRRRSVREIAESHRATEKAVESLLTRAREAFRQAYESAGEDTDEA